MNEKAEIGTSISTPYTTGVIALIRHKNPSWSPEQIKQSLLTTAVPKGYSPIQEGSGLIQGFQASNVKIAITPVNILFSPIWGESGIDYQERFIKIKNIDTEARAILLGLPQLKSLNIEAPTDFILQPSEEKVIRVSLTLPIKPLPNNIYGHIRCISIRHVRNGHELETQYVPVLVMVNPDPPVVKISGVKKTELNEFVIDYSVLFDHSSINV